jgi:hypothetical protein
VVQKVVDAASAAAASIPTPNAAPKPTAASAATASAPTASSAAAAADAKGDAALAVSGDAHADHTAEEEEALHRELAAKKKMQARQEALTRRVDAMLDRIEKTIQDVTHLPPSLSLHLLPF